MTLCVQTAKGDVLQKHIYYLILEHSLYCIHHMSLDRHDLQMHIQTRLIQRNIYKIHPSTNT